MKISKIFYGMLFVTITTFSSGQSALVTSANAPLKKTLTSKPTSYAVPKRPVKKVQTAQPQAGVIEESNVAVPVQAAASLAPRKRITRPVTTQTLQEKTATPSTALVSGQAAAGGQQVIKATGKNDIQEKLLTFFKSIPNEIKKTLQLIKYENSVLDCSIMLDLGDGNPIRVGFSIDFGFSGSGLDSARVAIRNNVGVLETVTVAPVPMEKGFPKAKINIYPTTIPMVGLPTKPLVEAACKIIDGTLNLPLPFYELLFNPQPDALCVLNVLKLGFATLNELTVAKQTQQLTTAKMTEISVNFLTRLLDNLNRLSYSINEAATLKAQGKEPGEEYDPAGRIVLYQGLGDSLMYYAKAFKMEGLIASLKLPAPEELYYWYKLRANVPASTIEKTLGDVFMLSGYTQQVQAFNTKVVKLITNKLDYFDRKSLMDALTYFVKTLDKGCGDPKKIVGVVKARTDGASGKLGVIALFDTVIKKMKLSGVFVVGKPGTKDQPDQPDYMVKANDLLTQIKNKKSTLVAQAAKGIKQPVMPAAKIAIPSLASKPLKTIDVPIADILNMLWVFLTVKILHANFPGDAGYINESYKQLGLFDTIIDVLKIGNKAQQLIPVAKKAFLATPQGKQAQLKINAPVKTLYIQLQGAGTDQAKKKQIMQKMTLATIKASLDTIAQATRFSFKRAPNLPAETIVEFVVKQFGLLYRKSELFSSLGQVLIDPILKPMLGISLEELMPNIENSAVQEEQQQLDKMQSELADLGIDLSDMGDMGDMGDGEMVAADEVGQDEELGEEAAVSAGDLEFEDQDQVAADDSQADQADGEVVADDDEAEQAMADVEEEEEAVPVPQPVVRAPVVYPSKTIAKPAVVAVQPAVKKTQTAVRPVVQQQVPIKSSVTASKIVGKSFQKGAIKTPVVKQIPQTAVRVTRPTIKTTPIKVAIPIPVLEPEEPVEEEVEAQDVSVGQIEQDEVDISGAADDQEQATVDVEEEEAVSAPQPVVRAPVVYPSKTIAKPAVVAVQPVVKKTQIAVRPVVQQQVPIKPSVTASKIVGKSFQKGAIKTPVVKPIPQTAVRVTRPTIKTPPIKVAIPIPVLEPEEPAEEEVEEQDVSAGQIEQDEVDISGAADDQDQVAADDGQTDRAEGEVVVDDDEAAQAESEVGDEEVAAVSVSQPIVKAPAVFQAKSVSVTPKTIAAPSVIITPKTTPQKNVTITSRLAQQRR